MGELWHVLLYQPLVNALIFLYQILFSNLGLAIIGLTFLIRGLLIPLTLPSLKASQKIKELAPEIEKLKKRHANDKQAFARAQMELYKKHGANPAAGCLPQIIQLVILIALFQAFNQVLKADGDVIARLNEVLYSALKLDPGTVINSRFLYLDLTKPDLIQVPGNLLGGIIPGLPGPFLLAAALIQFVSSKMMMPAAKKAESAAKKTPEQADDMAAMMQKQMVYLFPIMTIFIGFTFPSGLVLYWFTFSLMTAAQQYFVSRKNHAENQAGKN
jgi:YidC/Oxa1 family membrane protein insertase